MDEPFLCQIRGICVRAVQKSNMQRWDSSQGLNFLCHFSCLQSCIMRSSSSWSDGVKTCVVSTQTTFSSTKQTVWNEKNTLVSHDKGMTCIRLMWKRRVGLCVCMSSFEWGRPTVLVLEIYRRANPITQLSDAKSPLMALHVPELRMMMRANESSADIPYWNQWPLRTE